MKNANLQGKCIPGAMLSYSYVEFSIILNHSTFVFRELRMRLQMITTRTDILLVNLSTIICFMYNNIVP